MSEINEKKHIKIYTDNTNESETNKDYYQNIYFKILRKLYGAPNISGLEYISFLEVLTTIEKKLEALI